MFKVRRTGRNRERAADPAVTEDNFMWRVRELPSVEMKGFLLLQIQLHRFNIVSSQNDLWFESLGDKWWEKCLIDAAFVFYGGLLFY